MSFIKLFRIGGLFLICQLLLLTVHAIRGPHAAEGPAGKICRLAIKDTNELERTSPMTPLFEMTSISPAMAGDMMCTNTWKADCPVPLERLRCVSFAHHGLEETSAKPPIKQGEVIVLDTVAPSVLEIFKRLYEMEFQIAQAVGIHAFGGSDEASMDANNSSAFNWRTIAGTNQASIHGYGLAIDINPRQNPFIRVKDDGTCQYFPGQAGPYVNRFLQRPGMLEPTVNIFRDHGFTDWGGAWVTPIDLHHFQVPRPIAEILVHLSPEESADVWQRYLDATRGKGRDVELENAWYETHFGKPFA